MNASCNYILQQCQHFYVFHGYQNQIVFLGLRGPLVDPSVCPATRLPVRAKNLDTYIQAYMPQADGPMESPRCPP